MRRLVRVAAAAALAAWSLGAPPVGAFDLTNCTLSVTSTDAAGTTISSAQSGADNGTVKKPLEVDWDGSVAYDGSTGGVIKNYTYHVEVFGVPTPINSDGVHGNDSGTTTSTGSVSVSKNLPFQITGLYHVTGAINGDGGSCAGSGWIKLRGDPIGTPVFLAAAGLVLVGLLLTIWSLPGRHTLRGLVGGLLAGVGAALATVIFSVDWLPAPEYGPLEVFLVVLLVCTGLGWLRLGSSTSGP
jgi:hypothetical protein